MREGFITGRDEPDACRPFYQQVLAARIDALPASAGLWKFIIQLSLGGFSSSTIFSRPAISAQI